jgi:hypothetical protein
MNSSKTLLKQAEEQLGKLKTAEFKLFQSITKGKPIAYPKNDSNSGDEGVVRGEVIRWLCLEPEVWKLCLPTGIDVTGARIIGSLDLSYTDIGIPLRFCACYFEEPLHLKQAKLKSLDLSGTHIEAKDIIVSSERDASPTSIYAEKLSVTGSVCLSDGFHANGCISLVGASIDGDLECSRESKIINEVKSENQNEDALFAQNLNVKGNIFLSNGLQITGEVNLAYAVIGGALVCREGRFTHKNNKKQFALFAKSINVTGSVYLDKDLDKKEINPQKSFESEGGVNFNNATIGGDLKCCGGRFVSNDDDDAFLAEGINVAGSVCLNAGFHAHGKVSFINAKIGRSFEIAGINQPKDMTLDLQFAKVQTLDHHQDSLPGKLLLNGLEYEALGAKFLKNPTQGLEWLRRQSSETGENFPTQPYKQLAKVLQASGEGDEAIEVMVAKEQDEIQYGKLGDFEKSWRKLLGIIDYGYRPQKALYGALLIVLLGAILFCGGYNEKVLVETGQSCRRGNVSTSPTPTVTPLTLTTTTSSQRFNAFFYSLDLFLPIIDLGLEKSWQPDTNCDGGIALRYYYWFHIIMGWALTTLAVAGYSGLVRKAND